MWMLQNVSPDTVSVTDTPIPLTWIAQAIVAVPVRYVVQSDQLQAAIFAQQLVVIQYGSVAPVNPWAPVSYVVLGTQTAAGLQPATLLQSSQTGPLTVGLWPTGRLLINVTSLATDASLAVGWQSWDGAIYYPVEAVQAAITTVGPQPVVPWNPPAFAGRWVWTVTGSSVTASVVYQVQ